MLRAHRIALTCALVALTVACAHRVNQAASPAAQSAISLPYVDLQPGWRVRVVIPLLRSGGYMLPSLAAQDANGLAVNTHGDLIGYQRVYYSVAPRPESGILLRFSRAEEWRDGKRRPTVEPSLRVFQASANDTHIRLIYLTRVSRADHDMAIVSANTPAALDEITRTVTSFGECRNFSAATCTWVPAGVAVTPEQKAHGNDWIPAK
jgi:hypothetical protein